MTKCVYLQPAPPLIDHHFLFPYLFFSNIHQVVFCFFCLQASKTQNKRLVVLSVNTESHNSMESWRVCNLYCHNKLYRRWCLAGQSLSYVILCYLMLSYVLMLYFLCYVVMFYVMLLFVVVKLYVMLLLSCMLCYVMLCYVFMLLCCGLCFMLFLCFVVVKLCVM